MTNQEILTKAIEKAIAGGWSCPSLIYALYGGGQSEIEGQHIEMVRGFITGHDFAKALWGYGEIDFDNKNEADEVVHVIPWQYHLQQLVIADDPIKYLGENI